MMSRPQKYIEGEALHSQHAKSNNALKLRVAVLVVCVLLVSALVVTYLLLELLKTRDMLINLEMKQGTVKADVTERPCSTVQPTCPEPEVKIITQPCSPIQTTSPQPPEINMIKQSHSTIPTTTPQLPDITMNDPCYKCEDGWKQHGEKCYYFSTNSSSWNESRTECRTKEGDLVKIDSEEEQNFLRKNVQPKIPFWIGLTDSAEEGRWLWVDGSPLNERLTFWFDGEPNNEPGEDPDGEDCVLMLQVGIVFWFDIPCKETFRSICEKATVPVCV
ncbi:FAD-dependent oxidoreductase domain-containing protein 1 [Sarotherodon galilaeus]